MRKYRRREGKPHFLIEYLITRIIIIDALEAKYRYAIIKNENTKTEKSFYKPSATLMKKIRAAHDT